MKLSVALGIVGLFTLGACGSPGLSHRNAKAPVKAVTPAAETTTSAATLPAAGEQGPSVTTPGLEVPYAIAKACGIAPRAGAPAPVAFDFDSAALAPEDREMLAEIAKCLTEGALRGRAVALVGRADPRGEAEYNMGLGGSRSAAVDRYLVDLGVGRDKLRVTSRGELDATGTSEDGWAKDRRVDIRLVD